MKIRTGHVSNSSSSSFIIAYKKLPKFDAEMVEKFPILKYINSLIVEAFTGREITSVEEWDDYVVTEFGYNESQTIEAILESEEFSCERYNEVLEALQKGYKIFLRCVDWHDEAAIDSLLTEMHDGENIIVIQGEN